MRIAISGAGGFLGSPLTALLRKHGHEVHRLVRREARAADEISWDPYSSKLDQADLQGVQGVVNLSGENLGERWSEARKKAFRASRLLSTSLLARTLSQVSPRPEVFVSASAVGIYGNDRGDERLNEESSLGDDFLALLCQDWEEATRPASDAGIRVVNMRSGVSVHPSGGMLEKLLLPFKMGAGGKIGSGDQWVSWIARSDHMEGIRFLVENDALAGPVNVTSPHPVTNRELAQRVGEALHRPSVAAVPATVVRLMLGREMADETVLASQRVLPDRLLAAGFIFSYPELGDALRHELQQAD